MSATAPIPDSYAQPIYDRTSLRAAITDYKRLVHLQKVLGRHIVQRATMLGLRADLDPDYPDWNAIEEELRSHEVTDARDVLSPSGRRSLATRALDRFASGG